MLIAAGDQRRSSKPRTQRQVGPYRDCGRVAAANFTAGMGFFFLDMQKNGNTPCAGGRRGCYLHWHAHAALRNQQKPAGRL